MRKIQLNIDSLAVESFATDEPASGQGTVRAYVTTVGDFCTSADDALTCARRRTDYASCNVQCECTIQGQKCHNQGTV
ncbi:MAG TPA: hypothetical protein VLK84_29370 [Longimicrobium sp.]|nr:hypothetical protein [Longimicrobium sp.]